MSKQDLAQAVFAMTPDLPLPGQCPMPDDQDSFTDDTLLLLASCLAADAVLTYAEYELLQSTAQDIFGERALHPWFQAKLHYAVLHPVEPLGLTRALADTAFRQRVAPEQIATLMRGMDKMCQNRQPVHSIAHQTRESLRLAFAQTELTRRSRQLRMETNPQELVKGSEERKALQSREMPSMEATPETSGTLRGVIQSIERFLPTDQMTPARNRYNAKLRTQLEQLERMAWTLKEEGLRQDVKALRQSLGDQPFRVVLVGEGKRGKSSLINALLGEEISGVQEAVPETACVAEFVFSPQPAYRVRFLDEEEFQHLHAYLEGEVDRHSLMAQLESIRITLKEKPPPRINCREDLPQYLSVAGRYSAFTAKVRVGLPWEFLHQGLVLADTPGLNSTDPLHDYLAYEESLRADCLIFVLDARRPDSHSELRLLRKLAAAGRAVSIVGVLTGIDFLASTEVLEKVKARALQLLQQGCQGAAGLQVLGLVAINARQAMELRCQGSHTVSYDALPNQGLGLAPALKKLGSLLGLKHVSTPVQGEGLDVLVSLIYKAMQQDSLRDHKARTAARCTALLEKGRRHALEALERYRESLPPLQFLEMLDRHADRLAQAANCHAEQARSVIAAAAHDLEAWAESQDQSLDLWEERLVLRIMDAAHAHASSLGTNFAKESSWREFDSQEAPLIARQCLDQFLEDQATQQRHWQDKLRLFHEEMQDLSRQCLHTVEEAVVALGDICSTTGSMDHMLVQSNAHMKRLALFLSGAGVGGALGGGIVNLIALGGAAIAMLTSPLLFSGALIMGITMYALHKVGNPEQRRSAFLDRKRKKVEQWAKEIRRVMEKDLKAQKEELAANYKGAVARGFVPALEILAQEATHLRLYLQVIDRIRAGSLEYEKRLNVELKSLEKLALGPLF